MGKIAICFIAVLAIGSFYIPKTDGSIIIGGACNVQCVVDRVSGIISNLLATIAKLLESVDSLVIKLQDQCLGGLLGGLLKAVSELLENLLGGLLGKSGDTVKDGDGGLLGGLLDGIGDILDGLLKGLGPLLDQILKLVGDLLKLVGKLLGRKSLLEEILGATECALNDTLCKITDFTRGREDDPQVCAIVQAVTSELTYCTNSLLSSVTYEMGLVEGLLDAVVKLVTNLVKSLGKCVSGDLGGVGNCLKDLLDQVTKGLDDIGKALGLNDAKPIAGLLTEINTCVNSALFNLISNLGSLGFCNNDLPQICYDPSKKK